MPEPRVTVILPTYRRPESLIRTLDGLSVQDPGVEWELVVIDNDTAPGAEAAFASRRDDFGGRARLVRETERGAAHARNRGIAEARGSITAMIDDDVVPAPDWLGKLVAPILTGRCAGAGGLVLLDPATDRPEWFDEVAIGGYLARWDLGPSERAIEEKEFFLTANCAFDTAKLRASGGFEGELGPRGKTPLVNDDAQLVRSVRRLGGTLRWVPDAVVFHELSGARLNKRYLLRRAYAQGRSDWILERGELSSRKFGGARVATSWLAKEIRRRTGEGLGRPEVRFHLACDIARTGGALREAARSGFRTRR